MTLVHANRPRTPGNLGLAVNGPFASLQAGYRISDVLLCVMVTQFLKLQMLRNLAQTIVKA